MAFIGGGSSGYITFDPYSWNTTTTNTYYVTGSGTGQIVSEPQAVAATPDDEFAWLRRRVSEITELIAA